MHIAFLAVHLQKVQVDPFIVGIMGNQQPAVPGDLGNILHRRGILQFLEQGFHIQIFQPVPLGQIPVFVLLRFLDENP